MNKDEIHTQKWNVKENYKVVATELGGFALIEQELLLNANREDAEIEVCCSHQPYINDLSRSEYFTLTEILVSNNPRNKNFILQVTGTLPLNALTIRKKIPIVSDEVKRMRSENAKKNLKRKSI